MIVAWESKDRTIWLGFAELPNPNSLPLERASLEATFLNETKGKMVNSGTETRGGHKFFSMTADRDAGRGRTFVTQIVVSIGGKNYFAIAFSEKNPDDDPDINQFLNSLTITSPVSPTINTPAPNPVPLPEQVEKSPTDRIAQFLGGFGCLLLSVCGLVYFFIWIGKSRKKERRRRRRDEDEEEDDDEDDSRRRSRHDD
jgi:hypothetical protein